MTARLAKPGDEAYIIERAFTIGQLYSPEWAAEIAKSPNIIAVVDPPTGFFWVQLSRDPTVVSAGFDIAQDDAQVKALYKVALAEALGRWPQAVTLESRIRPDWCQPAAISRASIIAKMSLASTEADGTLVYRISRASLIKALK